MVVSYESDRQQCQNSWFYMAPTFAAEPGAVMQQLVEDFVALVSPGLLFCVPASTLIEIATCRCISSSSPANTEAPIALPGSVMGDGLPLEMAAIITKYSLLKGQHGRGRIYMPSVPITFTTPATSPNKINATGRTAYGDLGDLTMAVLTSGGLNYKPVIVTRPIAPINIATRGVVISQTFTQPILGTVRRRRLGRGI
jgi:hypothetical protein